MSNCEEELSKKPVGWQITDRQPAANQQTTDIFPKRKICCENMYYSVDMTQKQ